MKDGQGKPQTWAKRVLCGSSSPGAQPTSAPPCTPECPRIGIIPTFSRPTQPRARPTFIRAWMVSTPWACWVSPMDHTKMPFRASRSISANRRIVARVVPLSASRVSQSCAATWAAASANPVVLRAMKSRSTQPSAASTFSTPFRNARSPPVSTGNHSSANFVPNTAESGTDGTQ